MNKINESERKVHKSFESTRPASVTVAKSSDCPICKTHGNSVVRIDGICESCYIKQMVDPIEKEIATAREVLTNLENAKFMHLGKMREARKAQLAGQKLKFRCEKGCGFEADQMLHLVWHEEKCFHTRTHKTSTSRVPKTPVEAQDEEVGI